MRILVTGGAGFIGSNIARRLSVAGHAVTVSDWFGSTDKWCNLRSSTLHEVLLPQTLAGRLEDMDFDLVVHMGAISATTETDVDLIVETNLELSCRIFDLCARRGWRLIYASSAATYGDGSGGFVDDSSLAALAALRPLNAYGWSKAAFDLMVARRVAHGDPCPPQWVGLKFFNVFGPNEYHKGDMRSIVHKITGQVLANERVTLFQSYRREIPHGGQRRDFIYVRDCVDVVCWLIDTPQVSGIFNVGTGEARSFLDLGRAVFSALDRPAEIDFVPMPEPLRDRYQYFTQADTSRLRAAGYAAPFTTLESAIADYVGTYLTHADPYH